MASARQPAELALGEAIDTYNTPLAQPGQSQAPGEKAFATAADRAKSANQQFVEIADQYGMLRGGQRPPGTSRA